MNNPSLTSPTLNLQQQQTNHIVMITFWSQFGTYAMNSILILFLTRPLITHGLAYSQSAAYAFMGISSATGYLMPILGGSLADRVLGLRRSILLGSLLLCTAYLFVMLSGFTIINHGDRYFLAAYALIPAANSLLIGTATAMVSRIHADDALRAKAAMTYYYLAINVGALLATWIAPELLESQYGPLSVLTLTFFGKAIAALNFSYHYAVYDSVSQEQEKKPLTRNEVIQLCAYLVSVYAFTWFAYSHVATASVLVSIGCLLGIAWFFIKTFKLHGESRYKQLIASLLILEAIVFFVIYNQMNSTLILLAQNNSDKQLLGLIVSPAQYQILNPLLIIVFGLQLPRFYKQFPAFSIPYQFAIGSLLASTGLLLLAYGTTESHHGVVSGNIIGMTYALISLAELGVSAVGLSMIGLYCDSRNVAFAMGTWYLGTSLSNTISASIAHGAAIPDSMHSKSEILAIYHHYFLGLGLVATLLSLLMLWIAYSIRVFFKQRDYLDV